MRRSRLTCLSSLSMFLLTCLVSLPVHAQFGGFGGGGFGGGGGGFGGGGFGGQNAGVVVDAEGVLRVKRFRDPGLKQRFAAAKAALNPELATPTPVRAISLNRLEAAVADRLSRNEPLTDDMKYLAGMLRIQYVFYYPESNDIVIAGPSEGYAADASGRMLGLSTGWPVLRLDDLVVALRAFPPTGEKTRLVGVSIDPTQEGLQRMQRFLATLGAISPRDAGRIAAGLRQSLGLQNVTVNGISPKTHFAQVMVEADYRMKLIGIGLEEPAAKIKSYVARANPRDVSRNAMERWYFTPDYECVRVSEDDLAMELVGWGVKLVGANELVGAGGVRRASGAVNRASQAFCQNFTEQYPQLASRSPVYAQLRTLIDMLVVSAFIQEQDYYGKAGWTMSTFMDESAYTVETENTPTTVESAVNVIWKGNTLMTPIGGGVNVQPLNALSPGNQLPDEGQQVQATRGQLDLGKLQADAWWWNTSVAFERDGARRSRSGRNGAR